MSTVLDLIKEREEILRRIKAANIGIGSNKNNPYRSDEANEAAAARKVRWLIDLRVAENELREFDSRMSKLSIN